MLNFVATILKDNFGDSFNDTYEDSNLLRYLNSKMGAVNGDSKTRRSLANIYAIYSLLYFYKEKFYNKKKEYKNFKGFSYTDLFDFYRSLYGGEKLQNHALNSRVNGEIKNKFNFDDAIIIDGGKYALHINLIYVGNIDISKVAISIIEKYIELLKVKDNSILKDINELKDIKTLDDLRRKVIDMLTEDAEARIFEIISYAILKNKYKNIEVFWGYEKTKLKAEKLKLYKTGRTNANDGGIDFVMKPLGRFFQVTEVLDSYDKYLLDIDKVMRFPITFVIKTKKNKTQIQKEINSYIENKSGGMKTIKQRYEKAIEEIITINELTKDVKNLQERDIKILLTDIETYYKLEMNL